MHTWATFVHVAELCTANGMQMAARNIVCVEY